MCWAIWKYFEKKDVKIPSEIICYVCAWRKSWLGSKVPNRACAHSQWPIFGPAAAGLQGNVPLKTLSTFFLPYIRAVYNQPLGCTFCTLWLRLLTVAAAAQKQSAAEQAQLSLWTSRSVPETGMCGCPGMSNLCLFLFHPVRLNLSVRISQPFSTVFSYNKSVSALAIQQCFYS
jgi:hypothetical protein